MHGYREFIVLGFMLGAGRAAPLSDIWRPAEPAPTGCVSIQYQAELLDTSASMLHGGRFQQAQTAVENYLRDGAQPCTYAVIAAFGVTADVVDARFLTTSEARAALAGRVRALTATQKSTNLDEAAKLVELLSYQLRATYGPGANRLVVHVYSDFESSPSGGKTSFSLGQYLARRMDAKYSFDATTGDAPEEVVSASAAPQPPAPSHPAAMPVWRRVPVLAGVSAGVLAALALCIVGLRSRLGRTRPSAGGPAALLVTESLIKDDGSAPEILVPERRIEVATGVPAVFSTDGNAATWVAAAIPGAENGELFRIEPLPDGAVRIQSPYTRLAANGRQLGAERRIRMEIREPVNIRLGTREFNVIGVFRAPTASSRGTHIFDAEALER